jgi:hypothetical protein
VIFIVSTRFAELKNQKSDCKRFDSWPSHNRHPGLCVDDSLGRLVGFI